MRGVECCSRPGVGDGDDGLGVKVRGPSGASGRGRRRRCPNGAEDGAGVVGEPEVDRGLFRGGEVVLTDAAEGADPVFGEFFKGGSGGDAVVGVAGGGVVLIAADVAYVLFHFVRVWLSAKIRIILNNRYLSGKCVRCGSYCGWRWGWREG